MKFLKRVLILLLIAFIVIQFFRPEKNSSTAAPVNHISKNFTVPADVAQILSNSCYDCHSNNTRYPWYFSVQPVAWWLHDHITEGKKHLNFDEYATYNPRRQYRKFEQVMENIKEDEMPLPSYLVAHGDAALSAEQKATLTAWCNTCMNTMKTIYPIDSLEKK